LPFRTPGLRFVLSRAKRPVYCAVVDGIAHTRTVKAAALSIADTSARVVILGPFAPPSEVDAEAFVESLRDRMVATLAQLRATPANVSVSGDLAVAR
jgi:hypothetical protein